MDTGAEVAKRFYKELTDIQVHDARPVGGGGAGGAHAPPFQIEIYMQQCATVCKVVSSRQSSTEFKVIGHPLT